MPIDERPNILQAIPKVLVIGGSYAGLAATVNLIDLCDGKQPRFASASTEEEFPKVKLPVDITIVDERDGYYHLIGNPLAFASDDAASKSWTRFRDIPALKLPNVHFLQGSAANVNCEKKTASIVDTITQQIREEKYDYLLVASGLRRTSPVVPQALNRDEFIAEAKAHTRAIRDAKEGVVVIGGGKCYPYSIESTLMFSPGAVGIEMASEIKVVEPWQKVTLIHSRDKLLSAEPLTDDFKERSLEVLQEAGVNVVLGQRVIDTTAVQTDEESRSWRLTLSGGEQIVAGHVITAISRSTPTSTYLPSAALDRDGYVKIDASLRFNGNTPNADSHFAAGDIASWSGIKRCGGAMHMGHHCAINIHQDMLKHLYGQIPIYKELSEFPNIMGLAVGKKAVIYDSTTGTSSGEDLMASYFGDDLANLICWNYMKLGQAVAV